MVWSKAVLQSVTKGKSYQRNSEMDPTPWELVHWMHKEMQTSKKKMKYIISWLLLSITAKIKSAELDPERPSSDFSFWAQPSNLLPKGKSMQDNRKYP